MGLHVGLPLDDDEVTALDQVHLLLLEQYLDENCTPSEIVGC